jgi:hypothetical protein
VRDLTGRLTRGAVRGRGTLTSRIVENAFTALPSTDHGAVTCNPRVYAAVGGYPDRGHRFLRGIAVRAMVRRSAGVLSRGRQRPSGTGTGGIRNLTALLPCWSYAVFPGRQDRRYRRVGRTTDIPRCSSAADTWAHADEVNQALLQFIIHLSQDGRTLTGPENRPLSGRPG